MEKKEPVFLIKNGYGDRVVMRIEQFGFFRQERRIDTVLQIAQQDTMEKPVCYDFDEIPSSLRKKFIAKVEDADA